MKVQNKTIVVTGGGNGIGRQIVLNLLAKGAKVLAVDINESALQATMQLAANNHGRLSTHLLDITNRDAVEAFANQAIERHGTIDGIVNNAGIMQPFVKVNDLDYTHIERVVNVNFYGVLYMTKAFLPHLMQRPEASIVNVSSMGGLLPVPGECIYGATKAAVTLLTEGLRSELQNTNVKMTLVCPGAMATDIKFHSGADNKKITQDDIDGAFIKPVSAPRAAEIIVKAMEKKMSRILIGKDMKIMYCLNKVMPKLARHLINTQMKVHIPD